MPRDQWAEARERSRARQAKREEVCRAQASRRLKGGDEGYYLPKGVEVEVRPPGESRWIGHVMQRTLRFFTFRMSDGYAEFDHEGYVIRLRSLAKC